MTEIIDKNYAGEGIYRENILDHYMHPQNFGRLEKFDFQFREFNPLCGDEETVQIKVENNIIKDIKFFGKGCAISMAASSMLFSEVKNKTLDDAEKITKENVFELLSVPISPVRVKCACLPLEALRRVIKQYRGEKINISDKKIC